VGREEMKKELHFILSEFKKTDEILTCLYLPPWEKHSVAEEFFRLNSLR
jgi:hypothetical protein